MPDGSWEDWGLDVSVEDQIGEEGCDNVELLY